MVLVGSLVVTLKDSIATGKPETLHAFQLREFHENTLFVNTFDLEIHILFKMLAEVSHTSF